MNKKFALLSFAATAVVAFYFWQSADKNNLVQHNVENKSKVVKNTLAKDQTIYIGNGTEPKDLDPGRATGVPESHIIDNLFEGLTAYDPVTLEPIPGVAKKWEISKDGKTYTFLLREDSRWSDGKNVTAHDFEWSWKRVLDPKTASEYAYQLYYLKGAEDYNKGEIKNSNQVGVKALSNYKLQVVLENPTPFFLRLTSFHTLYPVPRHVIEKYKDIWTKQDYIVSNGPFELTEWKMKEYVKLIKSPNYWDKENIKINTVYFKAIENENSEERSFNKGSLHMTNTVPMPSIPKYVKELENNKFNKYLPFKVSPKLGVYYYRFNTTKAPLNDKRVRKALAITVNRKLLTNSLLKAGQKPATNFTPDVSGYVFENGDLNESVSSENIKEAKRLLSEAGYSDLDNFPKIKLLYNTSESHKKVAVAIQGMWKELGIKVELFNQEWKVYLDSQRRLDFSLSRAGWIGDYPDPNTFLDMFVTDGGNNQTGWSNKRYDELIDLASKTLDQKKRFAYFKEAESILLDELPVLPIYFYTGQRLVSKEVKMIDLKGNFIDWRGNIMDRLLLKYYALYEKRR